MVHDYSDGLCSDVAPPPWFHLDSCTIVVGFIICPTIYIHMHGKHLSNGWCIYG